MTLTIADAFTIELLKTGQDPRHVAAQLGVPYAKLARRIREAYKLDVDKIFHKRIGNGLPNRLAVSDAFGYWFSGLFDGEGTLLAFTRKSSQNVIGVQLKLRADDRATLLEIQRELGGRLHYGRRADCHAYYFWHMDTIADLCELIVPLFDRYPLQTKKCREYELWRPLVVSRYIATHGGRSRPPRSAQEIRKFKSVERVLHKMRKHPKIEHGV